MATAATALALSTAACVSSGNNSEAEPALTTAERTTTVAGATNDQASNDQASNDTNSEPSSVEQATTTEPSPTPLTGELSITIVDTYPHDTDAFTQGLEILDGQFVEGTGLYGESDRRLVDVETGEPSLVVPIDANLFGEGLTVVGDEILQLTWKAGVLIRSDATTLAELGRDTYEGEGWGLCFDGEMLAMSNGSPTLTFRDPATLEVIRSVEVTRNGAPVERLNELECVNGQVLANIWLTDLIVVIDPDTGTVVATLDGSPLRPDGFPLDDSSFALNGIAHDPETDRFFLTGKLWPVVYEVELS